MANRATDPFSLPIVARTNRSHSIFGTLRHWLEAAHLDKVGTFGLLVCICLVAVKPMFGGLGWKAGVLVIAVIMALPIAASAVLNMRAGIVITLILSFFILGIKRAVDDAPLGTLIDAMISLMFCGLFFKLVQKGTLKFGTNPISASLFLWLFYNILQAFNPIADSQMAWVYTVRSMAFFIILYFILIDAITSVRFVRTLLVLWIFLATIGGAYGWWQEYRGFNQFEMRWIMEDQLRFGLLFQHGHFRKFSFFSDPMVFGFVMAYTSSLCICLLTGPFKLWLKGVLAIVTFIMLGGMLHSSIRSAFILIPTGLIFMTLITFKERIIAAASIAFVLGTVVVLMPTVNATHFRFQTAFRPKTDDSYQGRAKNQKMIQPYIQTHPIGGGLGSVGIWGKKFSPDTFLAKFPPDSGYMRIVVETGWIGLLLYFALLIIGAWVGIRNYFFIRDPELKCYMLASLTTFYVLIVANFPQEAIIQLPTNVIFFVLLSLMTKIRDLDEKIRREANVEF
jgi:O-antigen ligase